MDPLTDFDRALRQAMQVEPAGDFTARIRARVAASPRQLRVRIPKFALAAIASALLGIVIASLWRAPGPFVAESLVPHRDLIAMAPSPEVLLSESPQPRSRLLPATTNSTNVMVSRSEMLALQRLFAGITVAPPPLAVPADELSIPEIVIEPIAPLVSGPEGERQ